MAKTFSLDQVKKRMADYNITMSDADMALAQSNPDYGMALVDAKIAYGRATTDAQRQEANNTANAIRRAVGGYSGGTDGTLYLLDPTTPPAVYSSSASRADYGIGTGTQTSFTPSGTSGTSGTPARTSSTAANSASSGNFSANTGSFSSGVPSVYTPRATGITIPEAPAFSYTAPDKPTETNPYADRYAAALDALTNREAFSYDPNTDPSWAAYQKQYTREGKRAAENTLGQYATMTGGLPSTAAVAASQQAGNYYAAQLSDRLPELYQAAYNRYLQEYQNQLQNVNALRTASQDSHNQYLDALNQYNNDRNFGYGQMLDNLNYQTQLRQEAIARDQDARNFDFNVWQANLGQQNTDRAFAENQFQYDDSTNYNRWLDAQQLARQREQDALSAQRYADETAYARSRDALSDQRYADETAYNRSRDALSDQRYNDETAYNRATYADETAYNRGAYADETDYSRALSRAQTLAQAGDFSGYEALGYTPEQIAALRAQWEREQMLALYGASRSSSSGGGSSRSSASGASGADSAQDAGGSGYYQLYRDALNDGSPANYIASNYKRYGFTHSTGLSTSFNDWLSSGGTRRTSLDYSPDEGVFTWNGKTYNSLPRLAAALNEANLLPEELDALREKLWLYGFRVES